VARLNVTARRDRAVRAASRAGAERISFEGKLAARRRLAEIERAGAA